MEFGLMQGLAVRNSRDKEIEDLKYLDGLRKQNEAMMLAKAKMFSEDIEFQNGSNAFDDAAIRQESDAAIKALSDLRRSHPQDYFTNPDVQMQAKRIKQGLKSSPGVLRSIAYKDSLNKYNAIFEDAIKNPDKYDENDLIEIRRKIDNYSKYGNEEGDASAPPKPLTFNPPQELINVPKALLEAGKNINNFNVRKGKDLGEYMTEPKPEEVEAIKQSIMKQHAKSINKQAAELGLKTPEQIDKWLTDGIVAGFEPKYSPGDPNALWERGMRERELKAREAKVATGPSYTPFDDLFDKNKPAGNVLTDLATKVWNDKPKIKVVGNSNQVVDLTGLKMNYDGRYVTDSKGRRYLSGYVDVPLATAQQTGIWEGDEEDGGITSAFLGKAVRRKKETKDGDGLTYVKVDYLLPIDKNDGTARQLYNTHAQPQKLVNPLSNPYQQSAVSGTKEDFYNAGYSDAQIQEGINRGLINLR